MSKKPLEAFDAVWKLALTIPTHSSQNIRYIKNSCSHCYINKVGWPNGKALDYESRDCRFDPCVDQQAALQCNAFIFAIFL